MPVGAGSLPFTVNFQRVERDLSDGEPEGLGVLLTLPHSTGDLL